MVSSWATSESISGWLENTADWLECTVGFRRRMGRWVNNLEMSESTSGKMGSRMERLGNSAESWGSSWDLLASKKE